MRSEERWEIFIEQQPQFMRVLRKLAATDWFSGGGWAAFIGAYHAGVYMQVYKCNWFNHGLDGIHFETGLTAESLATKTLTVDLHVGHRNLFDRQRFNELTVGPMEALVKTWDVPVRFSRTNLSERLRMDVRFTKSGFPQQVTDAFTRLSELAPIIDEGLRQL